MTAEAYADQYTSDLDSLLAEILDYTLANHPASNMISGHVQGKLLQMISRMIQPKRILEVGTFTGFSALCLAAGLAPDGLLYTLELREQDADIAQKYFNRSPYADKIKLKTGNALDIIPDLAETWDLAFIDADKTGYIKYYEMILPKLRTGGYILADNVLFHGDVLTTPVKGKNGKAIAEFNEHVKQDNRIEHVLLTVRDGLMLIQKK